MSKITLEIDVEEVLDRDIKNTKSNTFVSIPKNHQGKKAKILILSGVEKS